MTEFDWPVHPACAKLPMATETELAELTDHIRDKGLIQPLWLYKEWDGTVVLLDGRNRFLACKAAGVEFRTLFYVGDDPIGFSIGQNLKRRNLTVNQLGFLALEFEELYADEAAKRKARGWMEREHLKEEQRPPSMIEETNLVPSGEQDSDQDFRASTPTRALRTADLAARAVGVSGTTVTRAKRVARDAPDLVEKVKAGEMSLAKAEREVKVRGGRNEWHHKRPKIDSNRIVRGIVLAADNATASESLIVWDAVVIEDGWVDSLTDSIQKLRKVLTKLKEIQE